MLVFNAFLFWVVSYLGKKNNVDCMILAVIFAILHNHLSGYASRFEFFSMPDSRVVPQCPPGGERSQNGLDCNVRGEVHNPR